MPIEITTIQSNQCLRLIIHGLLFLINNSMHHRFNPIFISEKDLLALRNENRLGKAVFDKNLHHKKKEKIVKIVKANQKYNVFEDVWSVCTEKDEGNWNYLLENLEQTQCAYFEISWPMYRRQSNDYQTIQAIVSRTMIPRWPCLKSISLFHICIRTLEPLGWLEAPLLQSITILHCTSIESIKTFRKFNFRHLKQFQFINSKVVEYEQPLTRMNFHCSCIHITHQEHLLNDLRFLFKINFAKGLDLIQNSFTQSSDSQVSADDVLCYQWKKLCSALQQFKFQEQRWRQNMRNNLLISYYMRLKDRLKLIDCKQ